ncbi:helix-turn-helix domain-containing protein [uncultured Croceitalea sp.]|uniref:helix-turn-helix domain-containing protein n=1 Tax=uncultured Croceitalea sp. TaxID=1798908 RepID=UPI0033060ED2
MNQELLFFFSALGAFNGIVVGLYFLFFSKPKHLSSFFLGSLFLALSIRVGKSVFFYFYDTIADAYIQFGLFACWLIGPFLYFYVISAVKNDAILQKKAAFILLPLAIVGGMVMFIYPWSNYRELWDYLIRIIYTQWLLFVILSGFVLYKQRKGIFNNTNTKAFKIWISSIYIGNLVICIAFNTANYTSYIVGALSFSFVFYALILLLLFYKKRDQLLFLETKKYQSNRIDTNEAEVIRERLQSLVITESLYLDPNLTISKISSLLQIPSVKISQTLNAYSNTNFNDYINSLRIETAKKMIVIDNSFTLEAIAMDCGFNSKSTFYNAFKKHTGTTPSKFRVENTTA